MFEQIKSIQSPILKRPIDPITYSKTSTIVPLHLQWKPCQRHLQGQIVVIEDLAHPLNHLEKNCLHSDVNSENVSSCSNSFRCVLFNSLSGKWKALDACFIGNDACAVQLKCQHFSKFHQHQKPLDYKKKCSKQEFLPQQKLCIPWSS